MIRLRTPRAAGNRPALFIPLFRLFRALFRAADGSVISNSSRHSNY